MSGLLLPRRSCILLPREIRWKGVKGMKKKGFVVLLAVCVLLLASAAAETTEDAMLQEITVVSRFPWDSTKAEAIAYFESAGYAFFDVSAADAHLFATKTVNGSEIELFLLDEEGSYGSVSLTFSKKIGPYYLAKLVSRVFGPVSDVLPDTEAWNAGGGVLLVLSNADDGLVKLNWMLFDESLVELIPFQQADFPAKGLALAEAAKAAAEGTAADDFPAAAPEASSAFTFKGGITFGMTRAEVIAQEGKTPSEEGEDIIAYYDTLVQGLPADLGYSFTDGRLESIIYMLLETHDDDASYLGDYEQLKTALTDKYGLPLLDEASAGALDAYALWALDDVTISLHLQREDADVKTTLLYLDAREEDVPVSTDGTDI